MPATAEDHAAVLEVVRPTFRAVAAVVVPDAASLDAAGWDELEAIVEHALAQRTRGVRRQLVTLLRLIEWMPLARYGRRFSRLDAGRRERVLRRLQDAPVLLLRRGVWGLRTLAFMGYYARRAADERIGYQAHLRGWSGRPDIRPAVALGAVPPAKEVGPLPPPTDATGPFVDEDSTGARSPRPDPPT